MLPHFLRKQQKVTIMFRLAPYSSRRRYVALFFTEAAKINKHVKTCSIQCSGRNRCAALLFTEAAKSDKHVQIYSLIKADMLPHFLHKQQ